MAARASGGSRLFQKLPNLEGCVTWGMFAAEMVRNDCGQNTKILAKQDGEQTTANIDLGKKVTVSDGNTDLRKDP